MLLIPHSQTAFLLNGLVRANDTFTTESTQLLVFSDVRRENEAMQRIEKTMEEKKVKKKRSSKSSVVARN